MEIAKLALEFFKAIITWPTAILVLGLVFLLNYKEAISDFFSRMTSGQAYGVKVEAAIPSIQRKEVNSNFKSDDELERNITDNPTLIIQEYRRLLNGYLFERGFHFIYGTQIKLLEHISAKGSEGDLYVNLIPFYNEFLRQSNLKTTQYADYIGFLRDVKFVELTGEETELKVRITPFGADFLSYIKVQYPTIYGSRAF